jgi:hypothetical protein
MTSSARTRNFRSGVLHQQHQQFLAGGKRSKTCPIISHESHRQVVPFPVPSVHQTYYLPPNESTDSFFVAAVTNQRIPYTLEDTL